MVRWIVFDDDTADALVGKFKRGGAEIRAGNVLEMALRQDQGSLLIYPSSAPERVLLARVRPVPASARAIGPFKPLPVQPYRTGIGFRPPTFDDRRSWWRRHIA